MSDRKLIDWDDFARIDMRVGTVTEAVPFEKARKPAFILTVDFGAEMGIRRSSAQLTKLYTPDTLIGNQVIAVVNFPKKHIAGFGSEFLVLGVMNGEEVTLLTPERQVENGLRIG